MKVENTKLYFLIELLESFSIDEISRFTRFIGSTYFNTDQWVIKLLSALKQQVIGKTPYDDSAQTKIYRMIFGDVVSTEAFLNKKEKKLLGVKMSVLTRLAKRFLTIEALAETPACENELLNKKLLEKRQFRLLNQLHKKQQKSLITTNIKDIDYYALAFQVETGRLNYFHQKGSLLKEDNFPALIVSLDMYYLLNKLKIHATMLSIKNATKKEYDFISVKSITNLMNLPCYANHPLIITYRAVIQLIKVKEETDYFYLLEVLNQYKSNIPKNILIDFYNVAGNFCIRQIREGKLNYTKKIFDLYKDMHTKDLLLEGQFMQAVKLKSIVTIACKVNEFGWATKTVNHYSPFVNKTIQKSVYHFNLGIIDFYQHCYKKAISHLIRVDKVNLAYDLDSRLIFLQAYYLMDKDYDELTMTIFRTTAYFIHMHKTMPNTSKKSYKNFVLILTSLYQVRHQVGKKTAESIQKKLANMKVVLAKQWLLEQINLIVKK